MYSCGREFLYTHGIPPVPKCIRWSCDGSVLIIVIYIVIKLSRKFIYQLFSSFYILLTFIHKSLPVLDEGHQGYVPECKSYTIHGGKETPFHNYTEGPAGHYVDHFFQHVQPVTEK